jgi:hypothetical protein
MLTPKFTTQAAAQFMAVAARKNSFEIPEIRRWWAVQDWHSISSRLDLLGRFQMQLWVDELKSIVGEIIQTNLYGPQRFLDENGSMQSRGHTCGI